MIGNPRRVSQADTEPVGSVYSNKLYDDHRDSFGFRLRADAERIRRWTDRLFRLDARLLLGMRNEEGKNDNDLSRYLSCTLAVVCRSIRWSSQKMPRDRRHPARGNSRSEQQICRSESPEMQGSKKEQTATSSQGGGDMDRNYRSIIARTGATQNKRCMAKPDGSACVRKTRRVEWPCPGGQRQAAPFSTGLEHGHCRGWSGNEAKEREGKPGGSGW